MLQDPLNPDNDPELVAWRQGVMTAVWQPRICSGQEREGRKAPSRDGLSLRCEGAVGAALQVRVEGGHSAGHMEARQVPTCGTWHRA